MIYTFKAIPIKMLMTFFTKLEKKRLKFVWNHVFKNVEQKNKNITSSDF